MLGERPSSGADPSRVSDDALSRRRRIRYAPQVLLDLSSKRLRQHPSQRGQARMLASQRDEPAPRLILGVGAALVQEPGRVAGVVVEAMPAGAQPSPTGAIVHGGRKGELDAAAPGDPRDESPRSAAAGGAQAKSQSMGSRRRGRFHCPADLAIHPGSSGSRHGRRPPKPHPYARHAVDFVGCRSLWLWRAERWSGGLPPQTPPRFEDSTHKTFDAGAPANPAPSSSPRRTPTACDAPPK